MRSTRATEALLENRRGSQDKHAKNDRPGAWVGWVETTLFVAAIPLLGSQLRPDDLFLLTAPFPWACMAVLLIALRYGGFHGMACALALIFGGISAWRLGIPGARLALEPSVGLLIVGCVAGEFRDGWLRRQQQADQQGQELRSRLMRLSRGYHLLRASQERMEQRLAGSAPSLRQSLSALHERLATLPSGEPRLEALGGVLLGLMASHGGVQAAALHAIDDAGRWKAEPAATFGKCLAHAEDPLVKEALRRGRMVSVRAFAAEAPASPLLAAIPLVDVDEHVWGVVAISEMPFIAFNEDTLRLLAVLAAHAGDALAQEEPARESAAVFVQIEKGLRAARRDGQVAGVVALRMQGPLASERMEALTAHHRVLDGMWRLQRPDGVITMLFLLSLTTPSGVKQFIQRLEKTLGQRAPFPGQGWVRSWPYQPHEPVEPLLAELRRTCEADEMEDRTRQCNRSGTAELGLSLEM
ncbi:GAF domain-containing protein [Stigmatella sp. ncwal1]|uniref:GAF domain-containing protein n=1 Tax=Stigmatella ashevillensis TaxID=2995309 RepID=A0ABT5D2K8_9BACT|nr:GAF domain-containing protein [Stigmatella ashevillena]MDC0707368.1 GAF domain-containing protein [Stigmatella ashevillena]